jgi:hypothetical protein
MVKGLFIFLYERILLCGTL